MEWINVEHIYIYIHEVDKLVWYTILRKWKIKIIWSFLIWCIWWNWTSVLDKISQQNVYGKKKNHSSASVQFSSVAQSCLTLQPHGLQHSRTPCSSPTPGVCSSSCPLIQYCYLTISTSVTHFSSCLQSFPASGPFPMSQLFASGGQSIGASATASVLPMNIQGLFLLGLTGLISLLSKGLSRVFSNTTA